MGQSCYCPTSNGKYCTYSSFKINIQQFNNQNNLNFQNINQISSLLQSRGGFYHQSNGKYLIRKQNIGVYLGDAKSQLIMQGRGKLVFFNYTIFQGYFINNIFHGYGTFSNQHHTTLTGLWQNGIFKSGKLIHPTGIKITISKIKKKSKKKYTVQLQLPNKLHYKGQIILNNIKNKIYIIQGLGQMQFPDGSIYKGQWCQGIMDGKGKYIWQNGNYYQGCYCNGKRNGKGIMFFKQLNAFYQGFWIDGYPRQQSIIYVRQNLNQ